MIHPLPNIVRCCWLGSPQKKQHKKEETKPMKKKTILDFEDRTLRNDAETPELPQLVLSVFALRPPQPSMPAPEQGPCRKFRDPKFSPVFETPVFVDWGSLKMDGSNRIVVSPSCPRHPEILGTNGLPETNISPPENGGWKTILSFWDAICLGAMLVSGRDAIHEL